jgi:Fe-S cluster biogenesis protein NfuA
MSKEIEEIVSILDKEIKPMLAMHLGSLDFVDFSDGVVKIRFNGTCKGCPLSNLTLKAGIESVLKQKLNCVKSVEAVE